MKSWFRLQILTACVIAAMGLAACSDDDDGPTGTGNDTAPPQVASVTAVDANHINIRFNEPVERESAETENNYSIVETATPVPAPNASAPGDPIAVLNASLSSDRRTTTLTTATAMTTTGYRVSVSDLVDASGNTIVDTQDKTFLGSDDADETAPVLVARTPTDEANNVARTAPIELTFSEPVPTATLTTALAVSSGGNPVSVNVATEDEVHFTVTPVAPFAGNTDYTVTLIGVADAANNVMNSLEWSFQTATGTDTTPPMLVSSIPANNTSNISTESTIKMTFSEPINTELFSPIVTPGIGGGTPVWSLGNTVVTLTPVEGLASGQQYTVTLLAGSLADVNGNTNPSDITVTFQTALGGQP